jgi:hypothetical protein
LELRPNSSRLIVGLALGTCYLALGASQASASHVSCGDVITENTKLDADLFCPSGPTATTALTIGADGVKLDLGGHRINSFGGRAVRNDGHDGVAIRNGSIFASLGPIFLSHADDNRLEDLQVTSPGGPAVLLDDSDDNRVVRSSLGADTGGLGLINGSDRNVITRNDLDAGIGAPLDIRDSDENVVTRNLSIAGGELGGSHFFVGAGSDDTTVARNELSAGCCGKHGILVDAETRNTRLVRNEVRGYNGDGIHVESPATTLTRNSSNDNGGWGIFAVPGVIDGGHNTASSNGVGQCLNVIC